MKWISVKSRLPEELESVIVYDSKAGGDGSLGVGEGFYSDKKWTSVREGYYFKKVSHWQPMPKPPQVK